MLHRFLIPLLFLSSLWANPIKVLVSVGPTKCLVEEIGKDLVSVEKFVPAGASPHSYEPSPKQLIEATKANIWFQIGEGFEFKSQSLCGSSMQVVNLRKDLDLISSCCSCHDSYDPHIWLSVKLLKVQARHITEVLCSHMPEKSAFFNHNLTVLINRLDSLDQEIKTIFEKSSKKSVLVSHPAFGYFCKDYGIKQLSIEHEGKEPSPKQMTRLLLLARAEKIDCIFLEPQHSAKGGLRLANELKIRTEWLDPYQENVLENLLTIAKAFSK